MIRAIVFDFDGVLADTEPLHLAAYQEVFSDLGVTLTRDDYYENFLGYDDEGVIALIGERHEWPLDPGKVSTLIARKTEAFEAIVGTRDVLYPGAADAVRRLASSFPLGIASGALRSDIELILKGSGLEGLFRFLVSAEDTPESTPAPDPYLRAAELHGMPASQCVAIEDSRWGIVSAKTAGMKCVGITNTYPADELTNADMVINSLDEFTAELIGQL
jgi:HAD superfamily hydrolase (TIGR01509 family)